jgi:hypothetical protein
MRSTSAYACYERSLLFTDTVSCLSAYLRVAGSAKPTISATGSINFSMANSLCDRRMTRCERLS